MTATVQSWDEQQGRGWAVTTWPVRGRRVLLLRGEFNSRGIRRGQQKAGLREGDSISFVGLRVPNVAMRIIRSEFSEAAPYVVMEGVPRAPSVALPRLRRRPPPALSEDERENAAFYAGADLPEDA